MQKIKLTTNQVYNKLISEDKILEVKGQIKFYLGNVNIIIKQRDVVGNIMQEWLEGWLKQNKVEYSLNTNTQMPPDFYLDKENKTIELLEVKAFNYKASPGFDIADFNAYQSEIIEKPYMLNTKYLIFGYEMQEDGFVIIKKLWLKNVWEICRRMDMWPLNLQVKDNVVHKIRPCVWYSEKATIKFLPFKSLEDFISAIEQTVYQNPKTREKSGEWLGSLIQSYKKHYNLTLKIERWNNIAEQYLNPKQIKENKSKKHL
jgi:type II restriction enzyme